MVNQLKLQQNIAGNELKIGRTGYLPTIALFGKQTLYSNGVDKYLMPRTMIGVGFTWNIFDGLNREKKIRQARLTSQTLAIGKDKAVTELKVGVDKYYTQLQNALDNVKALNTTLEMSGPYPSEILPGGNGNFNRGGRCRGNVVKGKDRFPAGLLPV